MPIDERRRMALHRWASTSWDEEAADTLLEAITPAGQELATKQDLERLFGEVDGRFGQVDGRFAEIDHRFEQLGSRIEQLEFRLGERFERRIADAVTAQTRTLVFSQLGALVAIAALAFGLR